MEHLAVVCLLITNEVKEGNESFAAHFVYEFTLPEKHDVLLHLDSFFLYRENKHAEIFSERILFGS